MIPIKQSSISWFMSRAGFDHTARMTLGGHHNWEWSISLVLVNRHAPNSWNFGTHEWNGMNSCRRREMPFPSSCLSGVFRRHMLSGQISSRPVTTHRLGNSPLHGCWKVRESPAKMPETFRFKKIWGQFAQIFAQGLFGGSVYPV